MAGPSRRLGVLLIVLFWTSGTSRGATSLVRKGEARFTLVHSNLLRASGGGDAGWQRSLAKAATLCALLGYESMEIEKVHQYKHSMAGLGPRSGATVSTVECFSAEKRPVDAFGVDEFDTDDPKIRKGVQSAIDVMLFAEERERRRERKREEKLAGRSPRKIAADEAKRQRELEERKKWEEKEFAKALKKLAKSGS